MSIAGTVPSRRSGKGSWTPRRQGTAFSCLLIYSYTKNTHSFSKAGIVSLYVLSLQLLCWSVVMWSKIRKLASPCTKGSKFRTESGWLFQLACYMFEIVNAVSGFRIVDHRQWRRKYTKASNTFRDFSLTLSECASRWITRSIPSFFCERTAPISHSLASGAYEPGTVQLALHLKSDSAQPQFSS